MTELNRARSRSVACFENARKQATERERARFIQSLVEEFRLDVPELKDEERYMEAPREVQVNVTTATRCMICG